MQGMRAEGCIQLPQLREKGRGEEKGLELRIMLFHLENCRFPAQGMLVVHTRGMRAAGGLKGTAPKGGLSPSRPC